MKSFKELIYVIYCDIYRNYGFFNKKIIIKSFLPIGGRMLDKYIITLRISSYLSQRKNNNIIMKILSKIFNYRLNTLKIKCGIEIPSDCIIKEGLRLPHCGGIVINPNAIIGKNCEILQGVTIGNNILKDRHKVAVIGNDVFIGAGAKIIGNVKIGSNVTIGANAVVTKDIPDGSIVGGIPAKILSSKNSVIINNDYLKQEEFFMQSK